MKTILFQGDSITDAGRNQWDIGAGYPALVAAELGYTHPLEYKVVNRATSGNKSIDLLSRWRKDTIALKPDYVSVLIGVNDIWHEIDYQNGLSAEKYAVFCEMMVQDTRFYLPETKLIFLEPYITHGAATDQHWEFFRTETDRRIRIVNQLGEKYGFPVVPLQRCFNEACEQAPAENWTGEGVHATPAGHMLIKNAWLRAFAQL